VEYCSAKIRDKKMKFFTYNKILTFAEKKRLIYIILFVVIAAFLEILSIGLIIPFFNFFNKKEYFFTKLDFLNQYIVNSSVERIFIYLLVIFVFVYLIKTIFLSFISYYQLDFLKNLRNEISKKLFSIYLRKSYEFYLKTNSATLIQNLNDISLLIFFLKAEITFFSEILILSLIILLLLIYNPLATIFAILFFLLIGLVINIYFFRKATILGKKRQVSDRLRLQSLQQGFGAIKEIKIFRLNKYFVNQFINFLKDSSQYEFLYNFVSSLPRIWIEFFLILGTSTFMIFLFYNDSEIISYLPLMILFAFCSLRIAPSVVRILVSKQQMVFFYPVMQNVISEYIISSKNSINNELKKNNGKVFFEKKITLQDISFKYFRSKKIILNKVNINIKFGEVIGIIGPSGFGKTTLVSIIMGLLKSRSGRIIVDGKNIYNNLNSWQDQISYVPQNVYLIDDSLKSNIALGVEESKINYNDLDNSIKSGQLIDLVKNLRNGYNTHIGEQGQRLSAGQRQRIGIARALYKKSKLLILDEFTSSLDSSTEQKIIQEVINLKSNCTIILISHNEKIISRCQKIYSIDNKGLLHCKK
jgi:ABC-type multidrug transport system fused ATPase/permease subunit